MNVRHVCPAKGCKWHMIGAHDSGAVKLKFQKHWNTDHGNYISVVRWEARSDGK